MSSIYRIEDLTFDAGRQALRRGGETIHLGPLTYRLLKALIASAPNVVDHDELVEVVWGGRTISPETISQRVKLLRDAIGDDVQNPRYIELVRGRGYRLIPRVTEHSPEEAGKNRGARVVAFAIISAIAASALVWYFAGTTTTPEAQRSVAVLPFADMSPGQDYGYFADGMAEEILNKLSSTTPLRVIARTSSFSFDARNVDIAAIATKLNITHVIEGSVKQSGDRIRITVQLINAADSTLVWSQTYDRALSDVLHLQDEIARSVAAALEVKLRGIALASDSQSQRVKPEAYDLYLHGRQRLHDFALGDAEDYLEQSLAIDPGFIPAYSSLGEAYVRRIVDVQVPLAEYREKLRNLVDRGLKRAPADAGLVGLSGQVARYDRNIPLAEKRLHRALELDPANSVAQMLYCMLKGDRGYPLACDAIIERKRRVDPLNPFLYVGAWSRNMDIGNPDGALRATARYEAIATAGDPAAFGLRGGTKLALLGDIAGGIRDLERFADVATGGAAEGYTAPWYYYLFGELDKGDAALDHYQRMTHDVQITDFARAIRLLVTGDVTKARERLLELFTGRKNRSASYEDTIVARLAVDALLARGEADRAVEIIDGLAPEYATYRRKSRMDPRDMSPAPFPVKSIYSSYPALLFPDYIRALRASGDVTGAENMLNHLDAILQWRRERGLLVEERHVAEARALRGDAYGALDALERAEQDRTIYLDWQVFLLHNTIFADIRQRPRFQALIERVRTEMGRQRAEYASAR